MYCGVDGHQTLVSFHLHQLMTSGTAWDEKLREDGLSLCVLSGAQQNSYSSQVLILLAKETLLNRITTHCHSVS